jgi:hypothetical protein
LNRPRSSDAIIDEEHRKITDFAVTWLGLNPLGFGWAVEKEYLALQSIRDYLGIAADLCKLHKAV